MDSAKYVNNIRSGGFQARSTSCCWFEYEPKRRTEKHDFKVYCRPMQLRCWSFIGIAEKSFSLYPEFNFKGHKFVSLENKKFSTNKEIKSGSQNLPLEFVKFLKMQLLWPSENHKNHKIDKSGQNWRFCRLSIKQIITLEIVINSLSGRILKNATVEFWIVSQSCDLLKNSSSLVIQIYSPKDSGISLNKRFFGYASFINHG